VIYAKIGRAKAQQELLPAGPTRAGRCWNISKPAQVSVLAFLGGFIIAIAIGIICFMCWWRPASAPRGHAAAGFCWVVVMIVGLIIAASTCEESPAGPASARCGDWLALAMMALGPCAACYLLTLVG